MVFSSFVFLWGFLPIALAAYSVAARISIPAANRTLALAGYAFYAWSSPKFLLLMFATTAVDWVLALVIAGNSARFWRFANRSLEPLPANEPRSRLQRRAILLSVLLNLGSLGFFKYAGFLAETVQGVANALGISEAANHPTFHIILPLGISFYTFQSLSYTIDVYRGDARAMSRFTDFACFVSMFPHLVAGPILRFSFLAEQITFRTITREKMARGIALFCLGMAKKVLLANTAGAVANACFQARSLGAGDAWVGAVAYSLQIYFDFSGYSDMAVGLGLMLGFIFARNFDSPYRAESLTDFWRRWHISLSSWLREYLYVPLGGNRRGPARTYLNLIVTMLLGGLWHGAAWTYVVWGGIHGAGLAAERAGATRWLALLPRPIRILSIFVLVTTAWVFFRSESFGGALRYLAAMYGGGTTDGATAILRALAYDKLTIVGLLAGAAITWAGVDSWRFTRQLTAWRSALVFGSLIVSCAVLSVQAYNPFIYFIF